MFTFLDPVRDLTLGSIVLRMVLAFVCGGVIGIEREFKRRPAGFRTHILICLGAAITTLTSQYLGLVMGYTTDLGRLGAQVVAGIGFIGAGTIIVTRRQRVKGLTTAAGLWTCAIIGMALGAGFYEGAVFATMLLMLAEVFFSRLEYRILNNTPEVNLYIEYTERNCLTRLLALCQEEKIKVLHMEITREPDSGRHNACVIFSLRLHKHCPIPHLLERVNAVEGLVSVEEL